MIGVAVLGCGVVGYGVVQMLINNKEAVRRAAGQAVTPLYMLDLRDMETPPGVTLTHDPEAVFSDPAVNVAVETIGGTRAAYEFTKRALASGRHVVTSNKELVAAHGDELTALAAERGVSYLYEASVGGGIPVLHPILRCLRGNRLTGVEGIVNGSTNYLLTQMREKGVSFSAALGEARRLGYVEADPAADIEGWDARRKLAILANACFGSRFDDDGKIPAVGISAVTEADMEAAAAFGGAVKLVAHAQLVGDGSRWTGWVHPAFVPASHPLWGVNGVFNGIIVHGDFVGDVMFYGRGAGREPTASAVVGDIIDVARGSGAVETPCGTVPAFDPAEAPARRLLRTAAPAREALAALGWDARPCGDGLAVLTPALTGPAFSAACGTLAGCSEALYVLD